jgi:hypothetical protein
VSQLTIEQQLRAIWQDRDGHLWRTVGVITEPAVVIVGIDGDTEGARETHVLGSPLMRERFTELRPVTR